MRVLKKWTRVRTRTRVFPTLKKNDCTAETDHEKANTLANQFHSVSSTANYSIAFLSNRGDLEATLSYHLQHLSSYSCKNYRINLPVSKVELLSSTLSSKITSPGEDRLSQGGPRLTVSRARLFFAHNSRATYSYISANK